MHAKAAVKERSPAAPLFDSAFWAVRAKEAERLASSYAAGGMSAIERAEAEAAFRLLRYDGEVWVRRVVADILKDVDFLPADIAYLYAQDAAEVARPMIERSPVLGEAELLAVTQDGSTEHRLAVARRTELSARVCDKLCRSGEAAIVLAVLSNPGATILASTMRFLLDRRAGWVEVAASVAARLLAGAEREPRPASRAANKGGTVSVLPVWIGRGRTAPDARYLA